MAVAQNGKNCSISITFMVTWVSCFILVIRNTNSFDQQH